VALFLAFLALLVLLVLLLGLVLPITVTLVVLFLCRLSDGRRLALGADDLGSGQDAFSFAPDGRRDVACPKLSPESFQIAPG
jgi:hypothetical protein